MKVSNSSSYTITHILFSIEPCRLFSIESCRDKTGGWGGLRNEVFQLFPGNEMISLKHSEVLYADDDNILKDK